MEFLENVKEPSVEELNKLEKLLVEGLELVLGDGATKKIFKDRTVNITDLQDIYVYMIDEVHKYTEERAKKKYILPKRNEHIN